MSSTNDRESKRLSYDETVDFAIRFLASENTLGSLKGLSQKDLDDLYWIGHEHYSNGRYEQAEKVFHGLCLYSHKELRNWLAWGGALQMQKKWQQALHAYSFGQLMDLQSPEPAFRGFECHLALQNYREAASALETVLLNSKDEKHKVIHKQADGLLKELRIGLQKAKA